MGMETERAESSDLVGGDADIELRAARIERDLAVRLSALLSVAPDQVEVDLPFGDHGLDSSRLTALVDEINRDHSLDLTPVVFFEFSTVRKLARHLADEYSPAWDGDSQSVRSPDAKPPEATALGPQTDRRKPTESNDPIAIIGMAGRFPGAADVDALWDALLEGSDAISLVPLDRWDWRSIYGDATRKGNHTAIKWGGFIEGVDEFDPLFFNISPRDASAMDPQQRLLMGCAWKAIEDAGHAPSSLSGSATGVFLGTGISDYGPLVARSGQEILACTSIGLMPSAGPNRISHHLNLTGPSEPVETACSSSLVALHRAVCAIRNGDCELAIAGGVNVLLAPDNQISLSKAGVLSEDGRCHTFSDRANGYVRSEGVAAIVLKPLHAAERDGDHIYGLILGSSVNHGGRSSSLTAPNPRAQADLIVKALTRADVDPASIGYIEAHGTGTVLGDPIEVAGLKAAFSRLHTMRGSAARVGHCGLGSIKSNIGHLELAAGVAGVIKVLLQLKHRTLVRSLHSETINPYLDLEQSPFYVVQENRPWPACVDATGADLPRRAGVSSFSVTGTNAHVVIEEYRPTGSAPNRIQPSLPQAVVLSARSPPQLREYAEQLLRTLERAGFHDADLPDIAYTLQVGRDAMSERMGIVAVSINQLRQRLVDYLRGNAVDGIFGGRVPNNHGTPAVSSGTADSEQLLERWLDGGTVDWTACHRSRSARRLSLPTYPFARERYGLEMPPRVLASPHTSLALYAKEVLQQRSRLMLCGEESFLTDHRVCGERVLPAVAYLELALAASSGVQLPPSKPLALENVTWLQRCVVGLTPLALDISLEARADGSVAFEIATLPDSTHPERIVHAQGSIAQLPMAPVAAPIDLDMLRARCSGVFIEATRCYDAFAAIGLDYGPSHRAIEQIQMGEQELLARLRLPATAPRNGFILNPTLVDAATQALIGFALIPGSGEQLTIALPFELERVEVFAPCAPTLWAHGRRRTGGGSDASSVFDIDLYDDAGQLCVRLQGFSTRALRNPVRAGAGLLESGYHLLDLEWQVEAATQDSNTDSPSPGVLLIGANSDDEAVLRSNGISARVFSVTGMDVEAIRTWLADGEDIRHIVWVLPQSTFSTGDYESTICDGESGVISGLRLIQALLALRYDERAVNWTVITRQAVATADDEPIDPTHAGVHGLIGSLANEYPHWHARVLDVPTALSLPWPEILSLSPTSQGGLLAWRGGRWLRQHLRRHPAELAAQPMTRAGGVYLVIGGAGGIGSAWSEATLRRHPVQLIWVGRRALDASIQAKLDHLAQFGPRPRYLCADAISLDEMRFVRDSVQREFGHIDGIVHSTLVLNDHTLATMDEGDFRASYSAKSDSCIRLAQVFVPPPRDFALFFSAFNAQAKSAGQSNYVAGCTFSDAFARHLADVWPCRVRTVNWGYWGDVGVAANDFYRARMDRAGMASIQIEAAMPALDRLLAGEHQQLAMVRLSRTCRIDATALRLHHAATPTSATDPKSTTAKLVELAATQPRTTAIAALLEALRGYSCEVLGVEPSLIEANGRDFSNTLLGEFGMDSLSATALRNKLRHELGVDLRAQSIIGDPAGRLAELMHEQLLLRQISSHAPEASEETETFVI